LVDAYSICVINDDKKAKIINEYFKTMISGKRARKIDSLTAYLFGSDSEANDAFDFCEYHISCWKKNREFLKKKQKRILITSTMSAGKSTLINALVGKKINKSENLACTSKIHCLQNKSFYDGFDYEYDFELNLNADRKTLFENNEQNKENEIHIGTSFGLLSTSSARVCLIDTPGVNNSEDSTHALITKKLIEECCFDVLVYIVNAEYFGTDDDSNYLDFVLKKVSQDKIIFVLNKLDRFKQNEDSVKETLENFKEYLKGKGVHNPLICPVSMHAALLGKKALSDVPLSEDENDEYEFLIKKFSKSEYDLTEYYDNKSYHVGDFDILKKSGYMNFEELVIREI